MNFVYITTNLINGKQYIGSHSTNNSNDGYIGSGKYFLRSVKKYGKENFKREIIEECDPSLNLILEEKYIKEYNTLSPKGYNLSPTGGIGLNGGKHSKESKQKIKDSHKGKTPWNKGKKTGPLSTEHRKKIGLASKGRIFSESRNRKISYSLKGKSLSEDHKQKISGYQEKLNKPKIKCPYCKIFINKRDYIRGHRKRCKYNPKNIK